MARVSRGHAKVPKTKGILLIGIFKLVKGLALIAIGVGAHHLLHKDLASTVTHWIEVLRVDPDNRFIHRILTRIFAISPEQLKALSIGTFFYAGLLLTEGVGLLMRRRWAEYFTVITTAIFIPLEIYELSRRLTFTRMGVLALNIAIVWYLVRELRRQR